MYQGWTMHITLTVWVTLKNLECKMIDWLIDWLINRCAAWYSLMTYSLLITVEWDADGNAVVCTVRYCIMQAHLQSERKRTRREAPQTSFFIPQSLGRKKSNTRVYKLDPKQLHDYQKVQKPFFFHDFHICRKRTPLYLLKLA